MTMGRLARLRIRRASPPAAADQGAQAEEKVPRRVAGDGELRQDEDLDAETVRFSTKRGISVTLRSGPPPSPADRPRDAQEAA
jgi:hypothetical protein